MSQISVSEKFQHFDYGSHENLIKYGQSKPPAYELSNFPVPVSSWVGLNDAFSTLPVLICL